MGFLKSVNLSLTLSSFLLILVGVLIISSSSVSLGLQQGIFALFGMAAFLLVSGIRYRVVSNLLFSYYPSCNCGYPWDRNQGLNKMDPAWNF